MLKLEVKGIIISLLLIIFTSCARTLPKLPYVESTVSTFNKEGSLQPKLEFSFEKLDYQENNLEYDTYKKKIKEHLEQNNYSIIENSNLIIMFDYKIDNGTLNIGSMPIYGQTGISSSYTTGTLTDYDNGYASYSGRTISTPQYGVVGSSTYTYTTYGRSLILMIINKETKDVVYQTKVISYGKSEILSVVMNEMIEALFLNFPSKSGSNERFLILKNDL